ncbi:MAG: VWA domain-containing protein, partial [Candidatus Sedimenticola sp. 20ELBAFRAG]
MEEQVGEFWHKLVTRLADTRFPEACVELGDVERTVSIFFRALGGDSGLQITTAEATQQNTRRSWLQRLAGSNEKATLAWRDEAYLRLPASIDWLPETDLNRDLYLWLAALAVSDDGRKENWLLKNQRLTRLTLEQYPGLKERYNALTEAHIALRPELEKLPPREAALERAIRKALREPGTIDSIPPMGKRAPQPVPLWLHPAPPLPSTGATAPDPEDESSGSEEQRKEVEHLRRQAKRVKEPESDRGLVTVRMENIFTWGEFVNVDRGSEDEDDLERAESIARDLDQLAVSRSNQRAAATLKFDLDLPSEAEDDLILNEGILLPEWDWKKRTLQQDHCRIQPMLAADALPCELPTHLQRTAKRLRNQFQALAPARVWYKAQPDGQEVDIDAYLRYATDKAAGRGTGADNLYREMRAGARDLACLLLADLSLSTDTWINDHHRVIDVIRDSLYLFAESLNATGDRFGMYGFSSRKRDPVRIHTLKDFDERYSGQVRGRIGAIKPGYYTRMGAALRYGSKLLTEQPAGRRLLLILTDGKPNDLDKYEGRYGMEDTHQAVIEARRLGLQPFCVTIDEKGNDYLPHIFGTGGYVV